MPICVLFRRFLTLITQSKHKQKMNIRVSQNFKKMANKAIFAIILFVIMYVILLSLAIGITILCVIGGIILIALKPMIITIGLGIGIASSGFFILIFLFKFLFKQHKIDRSDLTEITINEEPKLFALIEAIVNEVQTDFPKKVYLSSDVNASVFYDSSFWSMFFPIRKNLQIGLGLINSITEQEFKAILAHEFGHFSQRSMKVGSYVYNVNQVIFNMLYDNESFDNMLQKWANMSGYFSFFIPTAIKIIQGIQWLLKKMYNFINISYMALSREMEFHADEIAANVAGYIPLKESLLRMDLADHSYNSVLNFYDNKIKDNLKSKNIYKEQEFVIHFLATEINLSFKNNLPIVSELDLSKYNKSKLNIKDQWASHPSIKERVTALENLNIQKNENNEKPAILLFSNSEQIQEQITKKIFSEVTYKETVVLLEFEKFKTEYTELFKKNGFPKEYNGYYDNKNPVNFEIESTTDYNEVEHFDALFCKENIDMIYDFIALENDKNTLINISNKEYNIKSFDYDGQKYNSNEAQNIIQKLETEINEARENIKKNDIKIYKYFQNKAFKKGNDNVLKEKYFNFSEQDSQYDKKTELYNSFVKATEFINVTTTFEQIKINFELISKLEIDLKIEIKSIIEDKELANEISKEMMDNFENYLSKEWIYFSDENYNSDNLQMLFMTINSYNYLLSRKYFLTKKDLLNYQIQQLEK